MFKLTIPPPVVVTKRTLEEALTNDIFKGTLGNDLYSGGAGNDRMMGSAGADHFDGGSGNDMVDYSKSGAGVDVHLTRGTGWFGDAAGDSYTSVENITGSKFDDVLTGNADDNWIFGGGGDDNISGRAGNDSLYGADGDDIIEGGSGADLLSGGAGVDTVTYLHSSSGVTVDLSSGAGTNGDAHGDKIYGFENITGSYHNDRLIGDTGDNEINALGGNDIMTGGGGADTFVFLNIDGLKHGSDLITDFDGTTGDRLDLSDTQYGSYADLMAEGRIIQNGNNAVIYTEANGSFSGDSITLENVDMMAELDASYFIF